LVCNGLFVSDDGETAELKFQFYFNSLGDLVWEIGGAPAGSQ